MAGLMSVSKNKIRLCDAGAGSGILISALCEQILKNTQIKEVAIDLYENDPTVLPLLKENMSIVNAEFNKYDKKLELNIIEENFILANSDYLEWIR